MKAPPSLTRFAFVLVSAVISTFAPAALAGFAGIAGVDRPGTQEAYLKGSDAGGWSHFGGNVAVDGDTVVASKLYSQDAYVFAREGASWTQQAKLTSDGYNWWYGSGCSVAISGDTIVLGSKYEHFSGLAHVFVRTGSSWTEQATLIGPDAQSGDCFGSSVAISGDTIVVGAPGRGGLVIGDAPVIDGKAYVFTRSGTTWTCQDSLIPVLDDNVGNFAGSVAVDGETAVVSSDDQSFVFVRFGSQWEQQAVIEDYWDGSVSISGERILLSNAYGNRASVFVRSGTSWTLESDLEPSNGANAKRFGCSASIFGNLVVVGADEEASRAKVINGNQADKSAPKAGAAYVFVRGDNGWYQEAYLKASNCESGDAFGQAVAVSGQTVVVGAPQEDGSSSPIKANDNASLEQGAVYVFSIPKRRADLMLGASPSDVVGEDVHNLTGAHQTKLVNFSDGKSRTFLVRVENDHEQTGSFTIRGNKSDQNFEITYFHDLADVTALVVDGTLRTGPLAHGEAYDLQAVVRCKTSIPNQARTFHILATSDEDPSPGAADLVRIRARSR